MTTTTTSSSSSDPFAELERTNWQIAVDAYDDGFGPLTSQAIPLLLSKAGFPPPPTTTTTTAAAAAAAEFRFLDVACGPGYVVSEAISAAKKRGGGPSSGEMEYSALDFSSNFLSLASSRLSDAHPDVDVTFVEGDACAMPFEPSTFDSVVCNFGVLHLPDPDAFLRESHRILKPGGKLSFSAWAAMPRTEAFGAIMGSVAAVGNPDVPLPEGPPFFRFGDPDECLRSAEGAGFVDVDVAVAEGMTWDNVKDADHLYSIFLDGTARTRELLRGQTEEEEGRVRLELQRRFWELTGGGARALRMPAVVTSGTKPET